MWYVDICSMGQGFKINHLEYSDFRVFINGGGQYICHNISKYTLNSNVDDIG